jgi:L-malate glycosyltransferase
MEEQALRVLLVNYEFPPIGGGAGRGTYHLARQLAKAGHQIDVLTSRLKGQPSQAVEEGYTVYRVFSWRKGIHDCGFRGALSFVFSAIPRFLTLTKRNQYDCIHYYFGLPTGLLSLLPGKHSRIPYLVSLRGSDVPGYDPFNKRLQLFHKLLTPITRVIWKRAHAVVALSNNFKSLAEQSLNRKFGVIPNGVETSDFPYEARRSVKGPLKLICVARLIERKGIQHIFQAIKRLKGKDIQLTVVGEGSFHNTLVELAEHLAIADRVDFAGFCTSKEVAEKLARHDAFVLPSMAESFGMVFVEAMSSGLPIIATRIGGIPDIISEQNGTLIESENVTELTDAIEHYYEHREQLSEIGARNRRKVEEEFSWTRVAERYEDTYRTAINSSHDTEKVTCK